MTNAEFNADALAYKTATDDERLRLEAKWGARAAYFRPGDRPTEHRFITERVTVFQETRTFYIGNLGPMVGISYPSWEDAPARIRNIEYQRTLGMDGVDGNLEPVHRLHPDQEGSDPDPVVSIWGY